MQVFGADAVWVILGVVCAAIYAHIKGWPTVIPHDAWAGSLASAIAIGALGGLLTRPPIFHQALWSL